MKIYDINTLRGQIAKIKDLFQLFFFTHFIKSLQLVILSDFKLRKEFPRRTKWHAIFQEMLYTKCKLAKCYVFFLPANVLHLLSFLKSNNQQALCHLKYVIVLTNGWLNGSNPFLLGSLITCLHIVYSLGVSTHHNELTSPSCGSFYFRTFGNKYFSFLFLLSTTWII